MTIQEIAVKIAELLQYSSDSPLLAVLPAYIAQAQQVLKQAGVKDTVVESEKAIGAIMRGVLDLWNFSAGDGKFSISFFQMAEQLKYNDGVNGKLILSVSHNEKGLRFNFTDGTKSELFEINCTGATEEQLQQIQRNTDLIQKIKIALNNGLKGKIISILGDSISTFLRWIPKTYRARYPQENLLTDVNKTWWKMLLDNTGAKLGVNDSWAGTTVSNTSLVNEGDSGPDACMASMTRIMNLGSNGTPDIILFYGGTNDIGNNVELGSFDSNISTYVNSNITTWTTFAEAYAEAIKRLQNCYPFTKIVVLLPTYTRSYYTRDSLDKYNKVIMQICDHFGVEYIDLRKCGINVYNHVTEEHIGTKPLKTLGDGIHPNEAGMILIERYVRRKLLSMCEFEDGENIVYSITNNLTNVINENKNIAVSANRYYLTAIKPVEGYKLSYLSVVMNGVDVTSQCVVNNGDSEMITVTNPTGDIVITAEAKAISITQRSSANEHIQEIPTDANAETNLYSVVGPQNSYYNSSGNWIIETPVVPSIVVPVLAGDMIYSNSFGEGSWLDEPRQGIRVTYLLDNEIITSIAPADVYAEYTEKGYITVPEGVNTACIPYWNKSDDNVLRIMTLHKVG